MTADAILNQIRRLDLIVEEFRINGTVEMHAVPLKGDALPQVARCNDGEDDESAYRAACLLTGRPISSLDAELGGQPMPDAVLKTIALKLSKSEYEVSVAGEPEPDQGTWTLDSAVRPKGMKITGVKGPNAGKTFPAIYELKADVLRVCYDLSGAKRPTEFKTSAGTQLYRVTYNQKKK